MKYHWNSEQSIIKDVTFKGDGNKSVNEAIIFAPDNAAHIDTIESLDKVLIDRGFNVSYDVIDNKPALRVTGFLHRHAVLDLLEGEKLTDGGAQKTELEKESGSILGYIRRNSITLAAIFYQLGNIATVLSGYVRRDDDELKTGIAFAVGDSSMLLFGKRNQKEKFHSVMRGYGEFLENNGFVVASDSVFSASARKEPLSNWGKIKEFMHDKVIAIKSISEMSAGAYFSRAGFKQNNLYKGLAGIMVGSGFGLGLVIPEKTKSDLRRELYAQTDEQAKEKISQMPFLSRAKYWLQSHPLAISGTFSSTNNILTLVGANSERKNRYKLREVRAKLGFEDYRTHPNDGGLQTTDGISYSSVEGIADSSEYTVQMPWGNKTVNVGKTAYMDRHEKYQEWQTALQGNDPVAKLDAQKAYEAAQGAVTALETELSHLQTGRLGVDGKNFWKFNTAQGSLFLIANILYGSSSKGGGKSGDELTNRFIAAAASDILRTPEETRMEVLNLAAQYAGNLKEIDFTPDEMRILIASRVEKLQQSPWMKKWQEAPQQSLTIGGVDSVVFQLAPETKLINGEAEVKVQSQPPQQETKAKPEIAPELLAKEPSPDERPLTKEELNSHLSESKSKPEITTDSEKLEQYAKEREDGVAKGWKDKTPSKGSDYTQQTVLNEEANAGLHLVH